MATKFSPCKGSYVLNQFPSNVMFGMNGFHVSASGAIQGHHGPLVFSLSYGPFMKFLVRSFSHQLLDRFGSNYTNRLSIKQRCAHPILVMVYLGFMELWPFDDSGQISFKLHG